MNHTTYTRNNMSQKCEGICGLWVLNEIILKNLLKIWNNLWGSFGSYLLNSTANLAQFRWKWAGLATSKRLPWSFSYFQHNCFWLKKKDSTKHFCPRIFTTYLASLFKVDMSSFWNGRKIITPRTSALHIHTCTFVRQFASLLAQMKFWPFMYSLYVSRALE